MSISFSTRPQDDMWYRIYLRVRFSLQRWRYQFRHNNCFQLFELLSNFGVNFVKLNLSFNKFKYKHLYQVINNKCNFSIIRLCNKVGLFLQNHQNKVRTLIINMLCVILILKLYRYVYTCFDDLFTNYH